ncbi:MAG TPA: TldD/PmbA family protein [Candidatus Hydrogenedentes bacterium]|nr:TldD/PmbA family protein [Candidatus Hydrogenedentota bacterium]
MDRPGIEQAIDAALHLGAAEAEIFFARSVDLEIEVARKQVETLVRAESIGIGVRVFTPDKRLGFAYTSGDDAGIAQAVAAACENARIDEPDEFNGLPDEAAVSDDDWAEEDFAAIPVARKVDACRALEDRVLAADARISHIQKAAYHDSRIEWTVANSRGLFRSYRMAHASCSVVAAATQAGCDSEMGWEFDVARRFDALRWDWVGTTCATRATRLLGGKPCAGGRMPVVFDPYVATQFLGVIGAAFMANNVLKGKSLFANRTGDNVASAHVTITDCNDLPEGINRAPFDGEGVSAAAKPIVEAGVLRGYLHNAYTARKMGASVTANAMRGGGFRSTPEVGPSNAYLVPGEATPESLFAAAGNGLYITDAMGVHTADPISGDFSFGVAGLAIENGQPASPVRGVTLAGNIKDLLMGIVGVGCDLRFFGPYGAPSFLISEIMIAGC